jgi:hypothetical protein
MLVQLCVCTRERFDDWPDRKRDVQVLGGISSDAEIVNAEANSTTDEIESFEQSVILTFTELVNVSDSDLEEPLLSLRTSISDDMVGSDPSRHASDSSAAVEFATTAEFRYSQSLSEDSMDSLAGVFNRSESLDEEFELSQSMARNFSESQRFADDGLDSRGEAEFGGSDTLAQEFALSDAFLTIETTLEFSDSAERNASDPEPTPAGKEEATVDFPSTGPEPFPFEAVIIIICYCGTIVVGTLISLAVCGSRRLRLWFEGRKIEPEMEEANAAESPPEGTTLPDP